MAPLPASESHPAVAEATTSMKMEQDAWVSDSWEEKAVLRKEIMYIIYVYRFLALCPGFYHSQSILNAVLSLIAVPASKE